MQLTWSHAVIRVRDLERMVGFYCSILDLDVSDRGYLGAGDTGPEIVFLSGRSSDHHQIAFAALRGPEDASSLEHMAFRVPDLASVREMIARVAASDLVDDGAPITHGNAISVYFKDPEGNGIEVFCDSAWHREQPAARRWDPSMSDEEVLADIEAFCREGAEFSSMEAYRARRAELFGER